MLATSIKENLTFQGDTLALFEKLIEKAGEAVLFESKDGNGQNNVQSLLFVKNAVRIEARAQKVSAIALTENGARAIRDLAAGLKNVAKVELKHDRLSAVFDKRTGAAPDLERIKAGTTADALRLLCQGWKGRDGESVQVRTPGIFSYDHFENFESLPMAKADRFDFPDFIFWLPETSVVVDHLEKRAFVSTYVYGDKQSGGDVLEAKKTSEMTASAVQGEDNKRCNVRKPTAAVGKRNSSFGSVDLDDQAYAEVVLKLKEHIKAGDIFQIVPSRSFSAKCPDPLSAYRALRRLNPSPYLFFVRSDKFTLFGSSPETCVSVSGEPRTVRLHPIAGTRPRGFLPGGGIDQDRDNRLEAELKLNEKELAEHMMLVDLARNDVARVSRPGTRRVAKLLEVERYSHVMHLVSVVEGELRPDLDAIHAYLASMNMGTLVGAPKIEAARLLRLYEADKRGPYGGAVGYFTSEGELDMAIIIRAALVVDGIAHVRAGAGVVYDSDPAKEAEETRNKAAAVLRAIEMSEKADL